MNKEEKKVASDNKFLSDNELEVKNSLFSFEGIFKGLEKTVAIFFPSMRSAVVERFRAETISMVGIEAFRLAQEYKIEAKPIPPKMALPLIENMSLEHEPEMYEMWARLLVSSANNFNPLQQQYVSILSGINSEQATLLKRVYDKQKEFRNPENRDSVYEEYIDNKRYKKNYDDTKSCSNLFAINNGTQTFTMPEVFSFSNSFTFSYIVTGEEKNKSSVEKKYEQMLLSEKQKNMLLSLKSLGLIQYNSVTWGREKVEDNAYVDVMRCGVLLTNFGYSFIRCLENFK